MADTAQNLPSGHLHSPLFQLVPTELRLYIYRYTFAGSEIALKLHPDVIHPDYYTVRPIRPWPGPFPVGGRRSVFCSNGRYLKLWQPLLTCKQIYDEGLAIYWSETTVCNQKQKGYFSRGLFFERIPDFAKLHIQHLRNMPTCVNPGVKALQGIAFTRQASFAEALDAFPKLQTCSVQDGKLGTKPSKAMRDALVRHPEVQFLKTYSGTEQGQRLPETFRALMPEICKVRI